MKIYIVCDLEWTAGAVDTRLQYRAPPLSHRRYGVNRTRDVANIRNTPPDVRRHASRGAVRNDTTRTEQRRLA